MIPQHIEFSLGEFATYEFARESGAQIVEASMVASGVSLFTTATGSRRTAVLQAQGVATPGIKSGSALYGVMKPKGADTTSFGGGAIAHSSARSESDSGGVLRANRVTIAKFDANGAAYTIFKVIDFNTFDIRGQASVAFNTSAVASVRMTIAPQIEVDWVATSTANGVLQAIGTSSETLYGAAMADGDMSVAAGAESSLRASAYGMGAIATAGISVVNMRGLAKASARAVARGAATTNMVGFAKTYKASAFKSYGTVDMSLVGERRAVSSADMSSVGSSMTNIEIVSVAELWMSSVGSTVVVFRRGKAVSAYLPLAYDVVIRPEENRTATWS